MNAIPIPRAKRIFDIFASILVIILLSPLIVLLLCVFVLEELFIPSARGSFFYTETRISQGKPFTLWKFRTFKTKTLSDARATGNLIHTKELEKNTQNLTLTGRILRQIYMDEAPQIISVLIGDMSLVGPRPTNSENYARDVQNGFQAKRILKAGLTGRFQTRKHVKYHLNQEAVDMEYADMCASRSSLRVVLYDMKILLDTALTVFRAEGL